MKTSIGYDKENVKEKREIEGEREREKGRRRDIERQGELRERERERGDNFPTCHNFRDIIFVFREFSLDFCNFVIEKE